MTDDEITPERRIALLGAALHAIAWQLVEYETDTSDRGVSEEHYRDAVERAKAVLPTLMPGAVAEEPEWETEEIQYGHLLEGGIFIVEHRGKNYSTHQRRIKLGRPESSWVADESAAPWARRDGCFAHCDPEGWFAPCQMPVKQEGAEE